jgi:hypothetical protein
MQESNVIVHNVRTSPIIIFVDFYLRQGVTALSLLGAVVAFFNLTAQTYDIKRLDS